MDLESELLLFQADLSDALLVWVQDFFLRQHQQLSAAGFVVRLRLVTMM